MTRFFGDFPPIFFGIPAFTFERSHPFFSSMLAPHFHAAAIGQTLPMRETPMKMLPLRKPPPVVQIRQSTTECIQVNNNCTTKRKLDEDRWLKTTSDEELGRIITYESIDENTTAVNTNMLNLIVRIDGIIVNASKPEFVGSQVVHYQV